MVRRFIVEPQIAAPFPALEIGVLVVRGLDNRKQAGMDCDQLLDRGAWKPEGTWRDAFRRFKAKKGARSSVEALLKRIANEKPVGSINPVVDLHNFISMKYALPCGGETLGAIHGDLVLTVAAGGEPVWPPASHRRISPPRFRSWW